MTTTTAIGLLLATAALLPAVSGIDFTESDLASDESLQALYDRWTARYSVSRDAGERARRFEIFAGNARHIHEFNTRGHKPYALGLNQFGDMADAELTDHDDTDACYRPPPTRPPPPPPPSTTTELTTNESSQLPTDVDWRMRRNGGRPGCVTDVHSQLGQAGQECGSCWAFAATAALEGLNSILTDHLVPLSAQELIDCSGASPIWGTGRGNGGCAGGDAGTAFDYANWALGLAAEADYPYTGQQGPCKRDPWGPKYPDHGIDGYVAVRPSMDEQVLMRAVAAQPVVVAVDVRGPDFKRYKEGVFIGPCGTRPSHQVALIGYGIDYNETGTPFWLIKNSWGEQWGEYGYMRMWRDGSKEGTCGILKDALYPVKNV